MPTRSSRLQDSPAKCLGLARALVVGLYTLKGREKNLMYSFKTSIPLKTGLLQHRGWPLAAGPEQASARLVRNQRGNKDDDETTRSNSMTVVSSSRVHEIHNLWKSYVFPSSTTIGASSCDHIGPGRETSQHIAPTASQLPTAHRVGSNWLHCHSDSNSDPASEMLVSKLLESHFWYWNSPYFSLFSPYFSVHRWR